MDSSRETMPPGAGKFLTTQWSLVLGAQLADESQAREALAALYRIYWYPLYAFVRRQGNSPADAQDLTQGFFARLIEKRDLAAVAREKGRFRSFLLAAMKHYLSNERDRARAAKRGGGVPPISLDDAEAEERYQLEPADEMSADRIYDRRWAMIVLERTVQRLRREMEESGKLRLFDELQECLSGSLSAPYADIAARLEMGEGALRMAATRMRQRYRDLLRDEIAQTVVSREEVEAEIRDLSAALRS